VKKSERFFKPKLATLAFTHFTNDLYGAFLATFTPMLVQRLGISLAQAGLLKSLAGVIHMCVQPMSGYFSDQFSRPYALVLGPFFTALGASLLPAAPSYGAAFLFTGLWGLGSAIYHPLGHGGVGHVAAPGKLAFCISIFSAGGILGATLSPLYAVSLVKLLGDSYLTSLAALVPVTVAGFLVFLIIPRLGDGASGEKPSLRGFSRSFLATGRIVYPIFAVSFFRETAFEGLRFLLPLLVASRGGDLVHIGSVLFFLGLSGVLSPMLGGKLADITSHRIVITVSMLSSPFFLVSAALTDGITSILLFMAGNAMLDASFPVSSAAAQQMAPGSRSTAASLVTGFPFGLAGLMLAPLGAFADSFGLVPALVLLGFLPLVPMPLFFRCWKSIGVPQEGC